MTRAPDAGGGWLQLQREHMEWADATAWAAALSLPAAAQDARVRELFHHTHLVQHLFLQIWNGEPPAVTKSSAFAALGDIAAWAREAHAGIRAFLPTLGPDDLQRPVHVPWAARLTERFGAPHPATLGESVLQIFMHSVHHRAQISTRLRELGGEPPLVDFIAWVWRGKPEPEWPG